MSPEEAARAISAFPSGDGDPVDDTPFRSANAALNVIRVAIADTLVDEIAISHRGAGLPCVTIKSRDADAVTLEFADKATAIHFYELVWQEFIGPA